MCSVSMIGDHYRDMWEPKPWYPGPAVPMPTRMSTVFYPPPEITRAEFDDLKRQVSEMVELLKRAKKYDADSGQPDCEMDEKMDLLRKVAKLVGVDLDGAIAKTGAH